MNLGDALKVMGFSVSVWDVVPERMVLLVPVGVMQSLKSDYWYDEETRVVRVTVEGEAKLEKVGVVFNLDIRGNGE